MIRLPPDQVAQWLEPVGFVDTQAAQRQLRSLCGHAPTAEAWTALLPELLRALRATANPDQALVDFVRLAADAPDRHLLWTTLASAPLLPSTLVTLFSGSQFLAEILLRHPEYLGQLAQPQVLAQPRSTAELAAEAQDIIGDGPCAPRTADRLEAQLDALRRWQRCEFLRIGVSDLLGKVDLPTVTEQLANLADAVVGACLRAVAAFQDVPVTGFAVVALGKLGGGELNYSSDIDLVFVVAEGPSRYQPLARHLIDALSRGTTEGFLYRVDMRLRPWGELGALVSSVDGYLAYLRRHGRPWEMQALLKARLVAGDTALGSTFLQEVTPLLYAFDGDDHALRRAVREMKERIEGQLRRSGLEWGEVKLGPGSIRDVEFVTQYLQLRHGGGNPGVRSTNTLDALRRLLDHQLLSMGDYRILAEGYSFLRPIEHYLQMMHYQQTHLLPSSERAMDSLARRLGFAGDAAGAGFRARYEQHVEAIRAVYRQHLEEKEVHDMSPGSERANPVRRHVARMAPSYEEVFGEEDIALHAELAGCLTDDRLVEVVAVPMMGPTREEPAMAGRVWRLTIVGYDFPGELSLICGLLFAYGFSIRDGEVFTYEPLAPDAGAEGGAPSVASSSAVAVPGKDSGGSGALRPTGVLQKTPTQPGDAGGALRRSEGDRRKIVDVFTVESVAEAGPERSCPPSRRLAAPGSQRTPVRRGTATSEAGADLWSRYAQDLAALLGRLQAGQQAEAHGELAKRAALALAAMAGSTLTLQPVDIAIDNDMHPAYTVLHIDAPDTVGFLYELTNALALAGFYIARVQVGAVANRAHDTLYLTDSGGHKVVAPDKQRQLRAAIVLIKHFTHLLPQSPNPEAALLHFGQLLAELFLRPDWPDALGSLERPEVLRALARLLGVSDFLWQDFLRMQYANLFPVVADMGALAAKKGKGQLWAALRTALAEAQTPEARRIALNEFKDREMFRVDMRHILGLVDRFRTFSLELTDLAEVVVEAAYRLCDEELRAEFGSPRLRDTSSSAHRECPLALCGLGKCGGRELGYASDIELIFVYGGSGLTDGPRVVSNAEYFDRLVIAFLGFIRAKREGIFKVDLQLRPYGNAGSLAVSVESFQRYFAPGGAAWPYERQSLSKLRLIAGDVDLGARLLALRDEYLYSGARFDVASMRAMRERQIRHLVTPGTVNAKFSLGGLVDAEYLVQGLQIMHGAHNPSVRSANTREAIKALAHVGAISAQDYVCLRDAHSFLRHLINALRMVRGNAQDLTVPAPNSEEFTFLARRLGHDADAGRLHAEMSRHMLAVQELAARLLAAQ